MLASLLAVVFVQQLPWRDTQSATTPPAVVPLVEAAARRNFEAQPYRVRAVAETEIAVVARRASGRVEVVSVQQQTSTLDWRRDSIALQHITGYRAEQVGLAMAMTRAYRVGWIVPSLMGERIRLRLADPASASSIEKLLDPLVRQARRFFAEPETLSTVHPLANDGFRFYEYPRADSVRERTPSGDSIDVIRIAVRRREQVAPGTSVFEGEVDVDAKSLLLTRMRGRIFIIRSPIVKAIDVTSDHARIIALVDLWNGPREDGFPLPLIERIDILSGGVAGEAANLVRFVTRFTKQEVIEPGPAPTEPRYRPLDYRVTYAPLDSQQKHATWALPLGKAVRDAQSQPLDVYFPDRMHPTGEPRFGFRARNSYEVFRFNKVEGLYTGLAATWYARDALPGFTLGGVAGYAWSEEAWRGRVDASMRRGGWGLTAGFGRFLDLTNDFRSPYDSGGVWSPLFWSSDNYDYVDRLVARVAVERLLTPSGTHVRLELGQVRDDTTDRHRTKGMFFGPFRPNRNADPGRYMRAIGLIEWNPDVQADLTRERFGAALRWEHGQGDFDYDHAEAAFIARQGFGHVLLIGRLYGGFLEGDVPTQQLYEIGSTQNLPGYDYKAFAGDRAWIARGTAQYPLPFLRAPFPRIAGFVMPAIAPELDIGVQTGMAWASDDEARASVRRLGDKVDEETGDVLIDPGTGQPVPASVPTEKLRATASIGLRLLSGAVYGGIAFPIDATRDTRRAVRLVFSFGKQL